MTASDPSARDRRVADSLPKTWVDQAPAALRPFLRLARYDRPVGFWLLAIPCWQGLMLAGAGRTPWLELAGYALLFGVGAVAMRGAGCTWNDIVDRDLDAKVARTADRPLAAGTVSLKQALAFLAAQLLVGLAVLIQLPVAAILTALASVVLVIAYPFMKRITWFPQVWLGMTFNWGVLVAAATIDGALGVPALAFYAGAILWTVGYDTIYACQDMEDDALVGVKSSARAFGRHVKLAVGLLYAASAALALSAAMFAGAGLLFAAVFGLYAAHLARQVKRFDPADGAACLSLFKSNRDAGLLLTLALALAAL
jgi:4-hydroxybenzoate polyprenyltransferase